MNSPEIVCLCGSCKFWDEFQKQNSRLTLEGKIVLSVGVGKTNDGQELTRLVKSKLDVLHLRKIDLADSIFVIDVGGYIGESTEREIEYAISNGKRVWYLSKGPAVSISDSIDRLKLSVRSYNTCAMKMGIKTVGELCERSSSELLAHRGFGYVCLKEIEFRLRQLGLRLKDGVQ
jgi:DNA-directed RNA polymerase alpha subunit